LTVRHALTQLVMAVIVISGCSPPGHPLQVENRDGPTLQMMVNGAEAEILACGEEMGLGRGEALFGPLPWSIAFYRLDGTLFASTEESVTSFKRYIVIRRDGLVAGDTVISGPVSVGCQPN
jgi:hypothetical protein